VSAATLRTRFRACLGQRGGAAPEVRRRLPTRAVVLGACSLALLVAAPTAAAPPKNVLIVASESKEMLGLALIIQQADAAVRATSLGPVNFYSESLERSRFGKDDERLVALFRQRYSAPLPDLVIALCAPAVDNVPESIPGDLALCVFRVVQESLRNVVKHSGSVEARVSLSGGETDLRLTVADTGRGFDVASALASGGLGLIGVRERLRLVGGEVSVTSAAGAGTRIDVRVPLATAEAAYLLKRSAASELMNAIQQVVLRRSYVTPLVTEGMVQSLMERSPGKPPRHELTPRQREVVQLLAEGRSMEQLHVTTSAELIQYAVRHHIV